jgi:hypothetical protein
MTLTRVAQILLKATIMIDAPKGTEGCLLPTQVPQDEAGILSIFNVIYVTAKCAARWTGMIIFHGFCADRSS